MFSNVLKSAQPIELDSSKFIWLIRACASLCFICAVLYLLVALVSLPALIKATATGLMRFENALAFTAAAIFIATFVVSSWRLFWLKKWAAIFLCALSWFGTFAQIRAFSGVDLPLLATLSMAFALTTSLLFYSGQLTKGF